MWSQSPRWLSSPECRALCILRQGLSSQHTLVKLLTTNVASFLRPVDFIAVVTELDRIEFLDVDTLVQIDEDCITYMGLPAGSLAGDFHDSGAFKVSHTGKVVMSTCAKGKGKGSAIQSYGVWPFTYENGVKVDSFVDALAVAQNDQDIVAGLRDGRLLLLQGMALICESAFLNTGRWQGIEFTSQQYVVVALSGTSLMLVNTSTMNVMTTTQLKFLGHAFTLFQDELGYENVFCVGSNTACLYNATSLTFTSSSHIHTMGELFSCFEVAVARTGLAFASYEHVCLVDPASLQHLAMTLFPTHPDQGKFPLRSWPVALEYVHSANMIVAARSWDGIYLLDACDLIITRRVERLSEIDFVAAIPSVFAVSAGVLPAQAKANCTSKGKGTGEGNRVRQHNFKDEVSCDDTSFTFPFQDVSHSEQAKQIDAEEAQLVSDQRWASYIQHSLEKDMLPRCTGDRGRSLSAVLLTFDRMTKELETALLSSPLASSLVAQGFEVKPSWAGGAKIFVDIDAPFYEHVLRPWHVIVDSADEADLLDAMKHLPVRYKKLKGKSGKTQFLQDLSLLEVSSEGDHDVINDATDVIPYRVRGTFIDIAPMQESRSVHTW